MMTFFQRIFHSSAVMAGVALIFSACGDEPASGPVAGACFDASTMDYTREGPYSFSSRQVDGYTVYVPKATAGGCNRFPLVGFSLGTAMPAGLYNGYYENFASWGITTVVDPANLINLGGGTLEAAILAVQNHRDFQGKILSTGAVGHSQGGSAVINVALDDKVRLDAVVGLMPALFQGAGRVQAAGLYIGGTLDQFSVATDPGLAYAKTDGPAFIADLNGATHMLGGVSSEAKGMSTAWLRCHLGKDTNACGLFSGSLGKTCLFEGNWARCEGKNF